MTDEYDEEPNRIELKIQLPDYNPFAPVPMGNGCYLTYSLNPPETKEQRDLRQIEQIAEWLINPKGSRNRIDGYD